MRFFLSLIAFGLLSIPMVAQDRVDPNKPDSLLTEAEAEIRLAEWRSKIAGLESQLASIRSDVNAEEAKLASLTTQLADCNTAIYELLGVTESDVNNFRERLGAIEARTRQMQKMSDEDLSKNIGNIEVLWNDLNTLRKEKTALLPEFYNRIVDLAKDIKELLRRARSFRGNTYVVGTWQKDRACLWNIAAKDETYDDPFMWPRIWQANTDQIRNPDLIYPGQVLRIPPAGPKTDEELKAERLYYRQKREAARRRAAARRAPQVDSDGAGSGN